MYKKNKKKGQKRITIKKKIILIGLAAILIPFFVSGTISFFLLSNSLFELTKERAGHVAGDLSASIYEKLTQEIRLAASIAADPDIVNVSKPGGFRIAQFELEQIYEHIGEKYFTIFLMDQDGIVRADAQFKEQIGLNLSDRDYFIQAKKGKSGVAGPVLPKGTAIQDSPIIIVYVPIQDKGQFRGLVAIPFDIDSLMKIITRQHTDQRSYAFLINDEGTVLWHPNRQFIFKLTLFDQPGTKEIKKIVMAKKDGIATYSFEGSKKIAGLSRMKLTGWTAAYTQNMNEVMAPVNKIIISIFVSGVIFVAITILIIVFLSKRVSTPIQKRMEILQQITQHSNEIVVQIGLNKKITYANPAFKKILGLKAKNIVGSEPCINNSLDLSSDAIWKILEAGNSWSGRVILKESEPDSIIIDAMIVPLMDDYGVIQSYLQIGRNITTELKYEERLEQSQKLEAIGTLAGGIAHDFNNILSAIFGYAELALMVKKCDAETENFIKQIKTASERARDLVNQILTFSRNTDIELRPLMPKLVLKEIVKLIRASIPAKIEIKSNIDSDSMVMAEATQLHQVVMNLSMNAAHAIGENTGTISLYLEDFFVDEEFTRSHPNIKVGNHVRIRISDTGDGIDPKIIARIFEPFFTTKSQGQGTGLGLSVVHGIVNKLNGIITVYSEIGTGTVFNIFIPCTETDVPMDDQQKYSLRQGTERILIIDDEQPITTTLQAILTNQGYKITAYSDSLEALKAVEASPNDVDIIISDYSMPKMSGLEVAERLYANGIKIPIILMSGFLGGNIKEDAQRIGIEELLAKPINSYQVMDAIHRIMD